MQKSAMKYVLLELQDSLEEINGQFSLEDFGFQRLEGTLQELPQAKEDTKESM